MDTSRETEFEKFKRENQLGFLLDGVRGELQEVLDVAKKKLYPYQDDKERLDVIIEKMEFILRDTPLQ